MITNAHVNETRGVLKRGPTPARLRKKGGLALTHRVGTRGHVAFMLVPPRNTLLHVGRYTVRRKVLDNDMVRAHNVGASKNYHNKIVLFNKLGSE